jgi:hypothetical protein
VHSEDEVDENNHPVRKTLFWRLNLLGTLFAELDELHIDTRDTEHDTTRAIKALRRGPHVDMDPEAKKTCKPPAGFPRSLVSDEFRGTFSRAARAALNLSKAEFNLIPLIEHCRDLRNAQ